MARVVAKAVDFLWAGFSAVLIAAAAVVTIVRLLLPEIGTQKEAIEAWIANIVGRPAVVGKVEASWDGWAPRISVEDIAFFDASHQVELVRFKTAAIDIAPLGSISSGSLRPKSLTLSGVALTVLRDENGKFSVAGMPPPKSPIIRWLVQQDNFLVTDADLTIIDSASEQTIPLYDLEVSIRQGESYKTFAARASLPEEIGGELVVKLNASGNPLHDDWDGAIHFKLQQVKSAFLLSQLNWHEAASPKATVDISAWSDWEDARLGRMRFDLSGADTEAGNAAFALKGELERRSRGWHLKLADLDFANVATAVPNAGASVAWHTEGGALTSVVVKARDIPLRPVANVIAAAFPLNDAQRQQLTDLDTSGVLTTVRGAQVHDETGTAHRFVDLEVVDFNSREMTSVPAVAGADFRLYATPEQGQLEFRRGNIDISHASRLINTVQVDDPSGRMSWRYRGDELQVHVDEFEANIQTIPFHVDGVLRNALTPEANADLLIEMPDADATRFHELVPVKVLPPRGERWIRGLFDSGRLLNSRLVLRGRLSDFPFRNAEGVLAADFEVADATAQYSIRWPKANGVFGKVRLRGPAVSMDVTRANVLGAFVGGATIEMPELFTKQRFLHITGSAAGPAQSASNIVMNSPLKKGKAARLNDITIDGDIEVDLDINSGLFPGGPREVLGQARFAGNRVDAPRQRVTLDDVTGIVSFTRGDWYGEGLTATFDGTPVGLVINGGLDDPNYDSEFRMTGVSSADELRRHLARYAKPIYRWLENHQSLDALSGELPWKAVLTIPSAQTAGEPLPRKLQLESSLSGLAVDLPWPFGKAADSVKPLRARLELLDGYSRNAIIDLGDALDARVEASRDSAKRVRIDEIEVLLGTVEPRFENKENFTVNGYMPRVAFSEWARLLGRAKRREITGVGLLPLEFDVQVSNFNFLGTTFPDIRLHGSRGDSSWRFAVDGEKIGGNITVPRDLNSGTVDMSLTHVAFDKASDRKTSSTEPIDPKRVPALNLTAENFVYGGIDLGAAQISTQKIEHGLGLNKLTFGNPEFSLTATGEWLEQEQTQSSHFDIQLESTDLARLLERFGYSVANIDGGDTDISIQAVWPGNPAEFALANLDGTFQLDVTDGQFLDIEPGGGRLFGLLSVQSLPRRLLLDFDDLFRKGFKFDLIKGVFEIENGNAYTNSLLIEGPAARIDISGRTGLAEQDYDQHMVVTPALSNSIPVAGALFGPIGVGAGAVYYLGQKMFKSIPRQIDKFLSREYSITGPWDNPSVEKI